MVINDLKKELSSQLGGRDTELLISGLLKLTVTEYALGGKKNVSENDCNKILGAAKRIKNGEPLQYAVGTTEFMSLPFFVSPAVLIPRPDTETLVEKAISEIGDRSLSVLDIGTGSGCVAVSISVYCKNAEVTAVDISEAALETAGRTAAANRTEIKLIKCDILNGIPSGSYDVIVSNPPYIETEAIKNLDRNVRDFEPHTALDGGADGLDFYRRIAAAAPHMLKREGFIALETGYDQARTVAKLLEESFTDIEITKDLCGVERVVSGRLKNSEIISGV